MVKPFVVEKILFWAMEFVGHEGEIVTRFDRGPDAVGFQDVLANSNISKWDDARGDWASWIVGFRGEGEDGETLSDVINEGGKGEFVEVLE